MVASWRSDVHRDSRRQKKRLTALGSYLLGDGGQPPEAILSVVCEEFHCPPDVALRQPWGLVKAVLDYRAMSSAKDLHKTDPGHMTEGQVALWGEMVNLCEAEEHG